MEIEEIKQRVKVAMVAVNEVPEPFKLKAFEVILSCLLAPNTAMALESKPVGVIVPEGKNGESSGLNTQNLCKITGLTTEQLDDVFHFDSDEPTFIGRINGNEKEKQVQVTRLLLLATKYAYGKDWATGSFLWKALKNYGIGSLDNLSHNLETDAANFNIKGKGKGREYKLTQQGETTAIESLKQFVTK